MVFEIVMFSYVGEWDSLTDNVLPLLELNLVFKSLVQIGCVIIIIIVGSCIALMSVRLDTPGAPGYNPGFSMAAIKAL